MGLAVGVLTVGNDADRLTLHVVELGVSTAEIEGDVVHPADGAFSQQAVVLGDGADEGVLRLVEVDGDVGVMHGSSSGFGGGGSRGRAGCGSCGGRSVGCGGDRDHLASQLADRLHQGLKP